jgi:hypothetical protein
LVTFVESQLKVNGGERSKVLSVSARPILAHDDVFWRHGHDCGPQKFKDSSSSTVQESVLVVKSVQYGLRHHSTWSVETMPLALEPDGEIHHLIGKAGPQRRVRSAAIVMR